MFAVYSNYRLHRLLRSKNGVKKVAITAVNGKLPFAVGKPDMEVQLPALTGIYNKANALQVIVEPNLFDSR